jgi:hypothetical protein
LVPYVEKAEKMTGNFFQRGGSASFFYVVISPHPAPPPHALEVTGDLDMEESHDGRRDNDLGMGLTGCDNGIEERPREEIFSLAFFLLSPARPNSRGS